VTINSRRRAAKENLLKSGGTVEVAPEWGGETVSGKGAGIGRRGLSAERGDKKLLTS